MNNLKRYLPYEEKFISYSEKVEKVMFKIIIVFISFMLLSQFLLSFDSIRRFLNPVEKIEGVLGSAESQMN